MKKTIYRALFMMFIVMIFTQTSKAQVYSDFDTVRVVKADYVPVNATGAGTTALTSFILPPGSTSFDDGYNLVTLPFKFEFNGDIVSQVYVCINGFLTFSTPLTQTQARSNGLFVDDINTYATNVIAPFWGDHYYRPASDAILPKTFKQSGIYTNVSNTSATFVNSNGAVVPQRVFTVEWRDLNLNKDISIIESSIGSFQVKIYESMDQYSNQSDIEFCYGSIGGNTSTSLTTVHTKNASVGLKGEFGDFINALYNENTVSGSKPYSLAKSSTTLTNDWTPSGYNNLRLRFNALRRFNVDEFWGDGDADFSKAPGRPHNAYAQIQGRYVTINDVRTILRSVAKKYPLDSIRRRAAYHADVDHNGRFYYATSTSGTTTISTRTDIKNRDLNYAENLPAGITSIKKIYYQANEFDASKILNFLSGKIPSLPWRYDSIPQYGKQNLVNVANGIKIGQVENRNSSVIVPIYANGNANGAISAKFDLNGDVINVVANKENNLVITDFDKSSVVIVASGVFTETQPIAFVEYTPNSNGIVLSDIVFNDNKVGTISTVTSLNSYVEEFTSSPNPFVGETKISFSVAEEGKYNLAIYDMIGNLVKELANNNFSIGNYTFNWDASNMQSGLYVCKLTSDKTTLINKLVVKK